MSKGKKQAVILSFLYDLYHWVTKREACLYKIIPGKNENKMVELK